MTAVERGRARGLAVVPRSTEPVEPTEEERREFRRRRADVHDRIAYAGHEVIAELERFLDRRGL